MKKTKLISLDLAFFTALAIPCLSLLAQSPAPLQVVTTRPQIGTGIVATTDQPANVSAYFSVGLLPQTAGTVKFLQKDIGDYFTAGEKLVEIEPSMAPGTLVTMTAPFDGVVANRSMDPGAFVASAAVVPEVISILDLQRTDIVTVTVGVPESFSMFLDDTTVAEVRMDALPGRVLVCKPTRFAPTFQSNDRTREVQIDIYNGTEDEFAVFSKNTAAQANLKSGKLPVFPSGLKSGESAGLMPGMFGMAKISTVRFQDSPLVPSSAILRAGGVPYLVKVENGVARRKRIAVEFDNGTLARVCWSEGGVPTELSPSDEFVSANQSAIEDGAAVVAVPAP
jgi:multidrug efflux pump subunit AcrA (membrane-fusion protein)